MTPTEIFHLVFCDKDFCSGFQEYHVSPSLPSLSELPKEAYLSYCPC